MGGVIQKSKLVYSDADLVDPAVGIWCPSVQGPGGLVLRDLSRYGNDGTLTNMAPATDWVDRAIDVDGTNDHVLIPSVFGLGIGNVTISGWAKLPTTSESGAFVKIGETEAEPNRYGYGIGVGSTNWDNSGNNLIALFENKRWINTSTVVGTDWFHYALVIDSAGTPETT